MNRYLAFTVTLFLISSAHPAAGMDDFLSNQLSDQQIDLLKEAISDSLQREHSVPDLHTGGNETGAIGSAPEFCKEYPDIPACSQTFPLSDDDLIINGVRP